MTGPNVRDVGSNIQSQQPTGAGQQAVRPWVAPIPPNTGLEDPREAAMWQRLRLRHFTPSGCGVDASVTTGATSVAITFKRAESNTSYGVNVIPSWSTTVYVAAADKATTGFTAHFGTAPSGSPGAISWATFRSED